jgi:hypothetical protein
VGGEDRERLVIRYQATARQEKWVLLLHSPVGGRQLTTCRIFQNS